VHTQVHRHNYANKTKKKPKTDKIVVLTVLHTKIFTSSNKILIQ